MAEKMNISFRIRAVDDFTKTMQSAQAQLTKLKNTANEHMSSYITVTVLDGGVASDLDGIKNHVDRLRMEGDVDIRTVFDNVGITRVLQQFDEFKKERPKSATVLTRFTTRKKDVKDMESLRNTINSLHEDAGKLSDISVGVGGIDKLTDINKEMKLFNKNINGVKKDLKKPIVAKVATEGVEKSIGAFGMVVKVLRDMMMSSCGALRSKSIEAVPS